MHTNMHTYPSTYFSPFPTIWPLYSYYQNVILARKQNISKGRPQNLIVGGEVGFWCGDIWFIWHSIPCKTSPVVSAPRHAELSRFSSTIPGELLMMMMMIMIMMMKLMMMMMMMMMMMELKVSAPTCWAQQILLNDSRSQVRFFFHTYLTLLKYKYK